MIGGHGFSPFACHLDTRLPPRAFGIVAQYHESSTLLASAVDEPSSQALANPSVYMFHRAMDDSKSTPAGLNHLYNIGLSLQELHPISPNRTEQRTPSSLTSSSSQRTSFSDSSLRKSSPSSDDSLSRYTKSPYQAQSKQSRNDVPLTELREMAPELSNDMLYHDAYAYRYPSQTHRPLIDLIRNDWQSKTEDGQAPLSPDPYGFTWKQMLTARRLRRYAVLGVLLLIFVWTVWKWWLEDTWYEDLMMRDVENTKHRNDVIYGSNMQPIFTDLIQLKKLNANLVPKKGDSKRLVFVGDVHGCLDELKSLLAKVSFNELTDHLVFTGDLISKGPSSSDVIDLALRFGASCVRGNHEDRLLLTHRDIRSARLASDEHDEYNYAYTNTYNPEEAVAPYEPSDEIASFNNNDIKLARSLNKKQVAYLASCPVILQIGKVQSMGQVNVVHAGLVPGMKLDKQDPVSVMTMRTMDWETHMPSRNGYGVPWTTLWNEYQSSLPHRLRSTVIYGHDSRRGFIREAYSKGLDTGCVKGGKLTALVVEVRKYRGTTEKYFSVKCKDYRPKSLAGGPGLPSLGQG